MTAAGLPPDAATAWYVYGIVPAAAAEKPLANVRGVAGDRVFLVNEGNLAALAGNVPVEHFTGDALAANLQDPVWLEDGVRAHDAVLEAALSAGDVVPFRFGTIYRSEAHLRAMLAQQPALALALEQVRDRVEFGVKGYLAPTHAVSEAARELPDAPAGRRYLEEKQQARRAAEALEERRRRCADDVHARLAALADDARANPVQPPEVSGREQPMFLNAAYLVRRRDEQSFPQSVAQLEGDFAAEGVTLEVTGPWPPYNFVEVEL